MSAAKTLSAQEHAAKFTSKQRTIALVIVSLAFVMDLLDSTIVNIAIPAIKSNLGASFSAIQWVVAGYSLAFALLLVTGGRMGDVFGYKKLFMFGVAGFTMASLLSGLAGDPTVLIATRILQGSMAALMVPQVMSLMQVMYKPSERGAINGLFGALGGLSASLGPVVGGLLIKANVFNLDWRPIFLINVPVGIFGLFMAAKYLPDGKSSHPLKLDLVGTGMVMAGMFLLVFPLIQGRELGWPAWAYIMMIASLPVFGLFAWWQRHKEKTDGSPLVLPSLFRKRSFTVGMGINIVFEMAMIGFFLVFGLMLQIGLGFSPIHAALTGLPTAIGIAMTMGVLGPLLPKLGRYGLTLGSAIMAAGLGITTAVVLHNGLGVHAWQLIAGLLVVGIGMGLVFGSLFAAVLNDVDPKDAGSASGTLNAIQQVGGAIGVALIGVVFFGQLNHAAPANFDRVSSQLQESVEAKIHPAGITVLPDTGKPFLSSDQIVAGVKKCFVDRSREKDSDVAPASCKQLSKSAGSDELTKSISNTVQAANASNFTHAFRWSIIYDVCLLAGTMALSLALPRRFRTEAYSEI